MLKPTNLSLTSRWASFGVLAAILALVGVIAGFSASPAYADTSFTTNGGGTRAGGSVPVEAVPGWQIAYNREQEGLKVSADNLKASQFKLYINDENFELMNNVVLNTWQSKYPNQLVYTGDWTINQYSTSRPFTIVYENVGFDYDEFTSVDYVIEVEKLIIDKAKYEDGSYHSDMLYAGDLGFSVFDLDGYPVIQAYDAYSDFSARTGLDACTDVYAKINFYLVPTGTITDANGHNNNTTLLKNAALNKTWCMEAFDIDQPGRHMPGRTENYNFINTESVAFHDNTVKKVYKHSYSTLTEGTRDDSDISFTATTRTGEPGEPSEWEGGVVAASNNKAYISASWRGIMCGTQFAIAPSEFEPPIRGSVTITGKKIANGYTLEANQHTFQLFEAGSTTPIATAKNDANGNFNFTIDYNSDDDFGMTYTYTIKEVAGSESVIEYDTHTENVKVKVNSDSENKALIGKVTYDSDGVIFTNELNWEYPEVEVHKQAVTPTVWE